MLKTDLYAIMIDNEATLVYDEALIEMFENGLDEHDLARIFMISVEDVKEVLLG